MVDQHREQWAANAAKAVTEFREALMGIAREHGRCTACGFVFCEHRDHQAEDRELCWPRACLLEDAPLTSSAPDLLAGRPS